MGRSLLFRRLCRALEMARGANDGGLATREYIDRSRFERAVSRRRFLELGTSIGALAAVPSLACSVKHPEALGGPRIAIIGAGIAGLTVAYRLARAGLRTRVFDSWNRVGGRMLTARNPWADGQVTELGGIQCA